MKILGLGENFSFGAKFWVLVGIKLKKVLKIVFEFAAKNSDFFRIFGAKFKK